jgi:hypothetical protein
VSGGGGQRAARSRRQPSVARPGAERRLDGDTLRAVSVGGIDLFHRIFGPLLVRSIAIPTPAGSDGVRGALTGCAENENRARPSGPCAVISQRS